MTERVSAGAFSAARAAAQVPQGLREEAPAANVTAAVVDRAVDETLKETGVSSDVARVMRSLLAGDSGSAVAKAFYHGVATGTVAVANAGIKRKEIDVPYSLSDEQAADLVGYAPDFSLKFSSREAHDHPVAAACRTIDRELVLTRLPPGAPVSHVGGAAIPLVGKGILGKGHHCCSPVVDKKDPARHVLVKLRLRKLASDPSVSSAVRRSAQGYLAKELPYVCDRRVQDCDYKTPVLTSVHVYDIRMEDWAAIMVSKGGRLVEGCILFPAALFGEKSAEMRVAGARYEVNAEANEFRMGFTDSPAWWYSHKLSDYLKYGVDQVLSHAGQVFSYKVVERRGDTLFFRILRTVGHLAPNYRQCYRVPGVPMVRINGFPVDDSTVSALRWSRRTYLFPQVLWEDMLGHAKEMVERGTLSHEKLFNYYRTVAPRQSINAVVVAGGSAVEDMNQLVPLVVHVVLFSFLEVRKVQIETQTVVGSVMESRLREKELTMYKVLAAFGEALLGACKLTVAPLLYVAKLVKQGISSLAKLQSCDWSVVPTVQYVSAKLVLPICFAQESDVVADFSHEFGSAAPGHLTAISAANPDLADFALQAFAGLLPDDTVRLLSSSKNKGKEKEVKPEVGPKESQGGKQTVSVDMSQPGTVETLDVSQEEIARRKSSIVEAIDECEAEAKKCEAACADHYRELMVGGAPHKGKIISRREMFGNPEFWRVSAGVIETSFSGAPVVGFQHAAVYTPSPFSGTRLAVVVEEEYKGMSQGEYVERVHYRLPSGDFSGWAYTNDSLLIHNGPAIAEALRAALSLPLDFTVTLHQGPPGCGKTTMIVDAVKPDDIVLVPVRKAARETAARVKLKKGFAEFVKDRVRTVDSYLVNYTKMRKLKSENVNRLLADEAFMTREGRWLAAAAHLRVTSIDAYGDKKQIPHVPRAECPKMHVMLRYSFEDTSWISYRCPPQLVACWGKVYDWRVRSSSKVVGLVAHIQSTAGREIPAGCVMMAMYQAEVRILRDKYANSPVPVQIMTVHESEGNTYRDVWLHRFDMRRRTDKFSLYDREEYALVAMSRSTHSFIYVAPDLGDQVAQWVKVGQDVRRIAAAADVATAGVAMEKL